ncbi:hypothetical protein LCGC14_0656630 [marine sediment metagenome]|uniref:Uncharacterized protein n=1 Tax=marine sediment metagenome TaxID=412755 RepID=A0A0F9REN7_9ZZZZ
MHYEDNILIPRGIILAISANASNNGFFIWDVPILPIGDDYFIKITSITDSSCWELSDQFYIGLNDSSDSSDNTIYGYKVFIFLNGIFVISIVFIIWSKKIIR